MKRKDQRRATIFGLIAWLALCATLILIATTQTAGSSKANQVDPNCITKPIANPLKDCKK